LDSLAILFCKKIRINCEDLWNLCTGIPDEIQYGKAVNDAISKINITRMEDFLTYFSSYPDRIYYTDAGKESSEWLQEYLEAAIVSSGYQGSVVSVESFPHQWVQSSVIVRFEGADPVLRSEVVVLGAHEDSLSTMEVVLPP